jgi:RHS repeat-associated protein
MLTLTVRMASRWATQAEGSLYQMRARYYDPKTAHFLSRDPLGPRVGEVKSSNRYEYASQNPMRYIDPAGTDDDDVGSTNPFAYYNPYAFPALSLYVMGMDLVGSRASADNAIQAKIGEESMKRCSGIFAPPPPSGGGLFGKPPGTGGTGGNSFITNGAGFDTGLAIQQDDVDPFGNPVPTGPASGGSSIWYKWTAPGSGAAPSTSRWGDYCSVNIDPAVTTPSGGFPSLWYSWTAPVSKVNEATPPAPGTGSIWYKWTAPATATPPTNPKTGLPKGVNAFGAQFLAAPGTDPNRPDAFQGAVSVPVFGAAPPPP